ncbi:MAG: phenylalanine--tRNA ligase subunit beta, partial [Terriglobales bacterium]
MKALFTWLGEYATIHASPRELANTLTLAGQAVDTIEERDGDALLELDLTSNRPDCLSHYGLAREISAITDTPLRPLDAPPLEQQAADEEVQIEAPEACGRYCALPFENVRVAAAEPAIARRLAALGQHAVNNVADVTNYVLWETGHPTHAFDAARLHGGRIRVRWARKGERLTTLDGVARELSPDDLVIADAERPVALAGVMGGLETAITAATTSVLIESAWFDPGVVRRTARRHGLHTEASHRFERGADPDAAPIAAARIAHLLRGSARAACIKVPMRVAEANLPQPSTIRLRPERVRAILGKALDAAECSRRLSALGCRLLGPNEWLAPSWRPDLTREIDLIEELARLHGYARFPSRLPAFSGLAQPLPEAGLRDRVRRQLRGRGFAEAIALSFA